MEHGSRKARQSEQAEDERSPERERPDRRRRRIAIRWSRDAQIDRSVNAAVQDEDVPSDR